MPAHASVIVSYAESPGEQATQVQNTKTMTFDGIGTGFKTNLAFAPGGTVMGTYDQITIKNSDQYGGAYNTPYATVSGYTSTLTLASNIAYFGLWWSAGDPANILEFYSDHQLVAKFTTDNLVNVLPTTYKGNPTSGFLGQNSSERYAYLNFFGQSGTTWDEIRITNAGSSGFESDNHSVRVEAFDEETEGPLPGVVFESVDGLNVTQITPTPEPASMFLIGAGMLGISFGVRRRRRS